MIEQETRKLKETYIPDPLRPVIHITHPFWFKSFCLSAFPTGHSCQKMFVEFPTVDIRNVILIPVHKYEVSAQIKGNNPITNKKEN